MVYLPLWQIWLRQLGSLSHSQYDGKIIKFHGSKPPTRYVISHDIWTHAMISCDLFASEKKNPSQPPTRLLLTIINHILTIIKSILTRSIYIYIYPYISRLLVNHILTNHLAISLLSHGGFSLFSNGRVAMESSLKATLRGGGRGRSCGRFHRGTWGYHGDIMGI